MGYGKRGTVVRTNTGGSGPMGEEESTTATKCERKPVEEQPLRLNGTLRI